MKFDTRTLTILKNFASINSGVVLREGTTQKTISDDRGIMLEAVLDEDIPSEFGIYDLSTFIGNLTTLKNPEITFSSESALMADGEMTLLYRACSPNLINTPPNKKLVFDNVDVKFKLTNNALQKMLRLAGMNSLSNLSVIGKDGDLLLKIHESSNDTSNYGLIKVGDYAGKDFTATFKTDNLKLLPDDYTVELQIGAFAKFVNDAGNLTYHIALEVG